MQDLKSNWSDKTKALVYLVIAIELAFFGYIAYDYYINKDDPIDTTATRIPNETRTTTDDCIMQFIEGKPFRICP